jgi:hypothetical protein
VGEWNKEQTKYQVTNGPILDFTDFKGTDARKAEVIGQYEGGDVHEAVSGIPAREELAAAAMYGGIGVGLATANPLGVGAGYGAGEFIAREIEQYEDAGSLPKLDTEADPFSIGGTPEDEVEAARHMENALHGAESGAGMAAGQAILAPIVTKILRTPNLGLKQLHKVFGKVPENVAIAQRLLGRLSSKSDTYSLTLGQYFKHVGGWVATAEQWARSAMGASKWMKRFDLKNTALIDDLVDQFFKGSARDLTSEQFGAVLNDLYGGSVKLSNVTKDWVYSGVKQLGDRAGAKFTFEGLVKAITRPGAEGSVGVRPIEFAKNIATGIEGYLDDIGLSLGQLAEGAELTTTQGIELTRRLNAAINNTSDNVAKSRMIEIMNKQVREPFKKTLKEFTEEGAHLYDQATSLVGKHADLFDNWAMKRLSKGLMNSPEEVISLFKDKGRMTTLKALNDVFKTMKGGEKLFEEHILMPMKYGIFRGTFDSRTGQWVGSKMVSKMEKLVERDGGDFANYIFGGEKNRVAFTNLAKTLDVIEKTKVGESVMIQLMQGGAMLSFLGGEAFGGGDVKMVTRTMGAIFLFPYALALMSTRPNLIRTITDGISHGPATTKFTRTAVAVTQLNKEAQEKWNKMSADAKEFYGDMLTGQPIGDTGEDFQPF